MIPFPDSIPGGFPAFAVELLLSAIMLAGAAGLGLLALMDLRAKRHPRAH